MLGLKSKIQKKFLRWVDDTYKMTGQNDLQSRRGRGRRGSQQPFISHCLVENASEVDNHSIPSSKRLGIRRLKGGAQSAIYLREHILKPRLISGVIAVNGDIEPGENSERRKLP